MVAWKICAGGDRIDMYELFVECENKNGKKVFCS